MSHQASIAPSRYYSHLENWVHERHYRTQRQNAKPITHTFSESGCLNIPEQDRSILHTLISADYQAGRKACLSEEISAPMSAGDPQVNIFCEIRTPLDHPAWDDSTVDYLAKSFARTLRMFMPEKSSFGNEYIYVSAEVNPLHQLPRQSNTLHLQTGIRVTLSMLSRILGMFVTELNDNANPALLDQSKSWSDFIDANVCSKGMKHVALRMNFTALFSKCPRCANTTAEAKAKAMFHCFLHHEEELPGEYHVVQVINCRGKPVPDELKRVTNDIAAQLQACSILPQPGPSAELNIPYNCPHPLFTPFSQQRRYKEPSPSTADVELVKPEDLRFKVLKQVIRESFPVHWKNVTIRKVEYWFESTRTYKIYVDRGNLCLNCKGSSSDPQGVGAHDSSCIYFELTYQGWQQLCMDRQIDPQRRLNGQCCKFSSPVYDYESRRRDRLFTDETVEKTRKRIKRILPQTDEENAQDSDVMARMGITDVMLRELDDMLDAEREKARVRLPDYMLHGKKRQRKA